MLKCIERRPLATLSLKFLHTLMNVKDYLSVVVHKCTWDHNVDLKD